MSIQKLVITFLLIFPFTCLSQTVLLEENFNSGIPATWTMLDADALIPEFAVSEFTNAWIPYVSGTDSCAASTSFYTTEGASADYLISPRISIGNFSKIVWSARSVDASYPDGYLLLISTTDSLESSFTDTLMNVIAEPNYFTERGVVLDEAGYANQDIFIAFKNITENGFILLLDQMTVYGAETASLSEKTNEKRVLVFPNPTANLLQIQTESTLISTTIYSLQGQKIIESSDLTIDVSLFELGMYMIQIETMEGFYTETFIKQ